MSKNHVQQNQDDLDAELDQFLATKKVTPVVSSASEGINLFGSTPEKKKNLLQRLLAFLQPKALA